MSDVPEGRCMVCRCAWEPCRRCKGQARQRKAEATMQKNGTKIHCGRPKRPHGLIFGDETKKV